jgi:cytochrome b561
MMKNTQSSYGAVARILHWSMAVLVTGMLFLGDYVHGLDESDPQQAHSEEVLGSLHKSVGILVFALVVLRAIWASTNIRPRLETRTNWQRMAALFSHLSLYALMLGMPLTGYALTSLFSAEPISVFGLVEVPPLVSSENISAAYQVFAIHQVLALLLAILIIVHVGAALKHHFIDKDNVLRRMLAGRSSS